MWIFDVTLRWTGSVSIAGGKVTSSWDVIISSMAEYSSIMAICLSKELKIGMFEETIEMSVASTR
jgi:hypothetical protein